MSEADLKNQLLNKNLNGEESKDEEDEHFEATEKDQKDDNTVI